jgi:hypothetical protein
MTLRILLSFWYYKDTKLDEVFNKYFTKPYPEVFADSGGFSAETQGATIDISEYIDWINRYKHLITTYANLDVIGDAKQTLQNQEIMESAGLKPLPVFHTGTDWDYLENYVNKYPYIALGGMVPYMQSLKKIIPWTIKAFRIAAGKSVFHGFGATSWKVVNNFHWYSVDSSSWGAGHRYGRVPVFDEAVGKFQHIELGDSATCKRHGRIIKQLGFNPLDFMDRERNDRVKICAISAISYMKAEQWLRNRWGELYIPGKEREFGLKQYLSDSNARNLSDADAGIKIYLADTTANI